MSALNYQPAELTDFSKGMQDDYVNGPLAGGEVYENFFVLNNRSLHSRPGTLLDVATNADAQVPLGTSLIGTLMSYNNGEHLLVHTQKKLYYRNPTSYTSLLGPSSNNPFNSASTSTYLAHTEWNRHLIITPDSWDKPVKVFRDNTGALKLRTAGLPKLASSPTLTPGVGARTYLYAFAYAYTYQVGDETFKDIGPLIEVSVSSAAEPSSSTLAISSIPALSNGAGDNYDTTNIKKEIYRTIDGGKQFFKVGEVTNATTSFNDTVSDATLQNNEPLYTTGGVPDNDPPPLAKFCHSVNGFTYYAYVKEGSEILPNDILQSQNGDPDSVPGSFRDKLEDEITGLSSVQDIPIVGCKKHVYRIDGAFDEAGRGGMSHKRISDHAGCISHESFVQAEGGLFWWGNDGIYYSEGFRCLKVTDHLNRTYKAFVDSLAGKTRKIKGCYNEFTRTVYWTVSTTSKSAGSENCDAIWGMDLQWGISPNMTSWLWKGGTTFYPSAIAVHNGILYRGDKTGYVLKFDDATFTDPKINPGTDPADWWEETIIWKWRSCASNFGTSFVRKMANKILLTAKNETNVSIAIRAINDDGKVSRDLTPIRWRKNFTWGDEEFIWGASDFVWYYGGTIEVDRRFPAKGLRFNYLQIEVTNEFTNIVNSDLMGECVIDSVAKTATLVDAANGDWPSQGVDYYIYLEHDGYTNSFLITNRIDDVLTLSDSANRLQSGTWKWQIKGYRKNEVLNLVGASISWAPLTRSHDTFNTGEKGGLT